MISILIVDDQKTSRETIKSIVETEANLEVVGVATNGLEAIKLAITLAPDIILMDLEMPYLNGLEATKLICQQNPGANIIILTIQSREDLLVRTLSAGAKGYLLKNTNTQEIINKIDLVYKGSQLVRQKSNKSEERIRNNHNGYKERKEIASKKIVKGDYSVNKINETNTLTQSEFCQPQPDLEASRQTNIDLSTLLTILKRNYPPALMGFLGVLLGVVLYLIFAQRMYRATASIVLENRQVSISELGKNLSNISGSKDYSYLASQAKLIKSIPILDTALENIAQEQKSYLIKFTSPEAIQKDLETKIIPNTNILEVSYENPNPEFAALILNTIIKAFTARNIEIIRSDASSVRQFLEKQLNKQLNKLNEIETAEKLYREQKGIVAIDIQTKNLLESLNDLETQAQNLSIQIQEQEAKVNSLQQIAKVQDAKSAYSKEIIGQDRQLEKLRTQLTDVEAELAAARSNFTDRNPTVIALLEKRTQILELYQKQVSEILGEDKKISLSEVRENGISQTKNGISQEVISHLITTQTQLEADRDKLKTIKAEKEKLTKQIALLPANVQSLTKLVRQREQANENRQFIQRKLEEARIAEAQRISQIQILELATPPSSPSSPKILPLLAIASILGMVLGAGIILLLEKIDRTLYEGTDIERQIHIPLLTKLPHLPDSSENLAQIQSFLQDRALYEPYRALLKRLESCSQKKLKVIVVTSAIAGEGKSVVASHLGAVSAMLSRRTLIIDAHLHQPRQHSWFDVKLQPGLTEIVTDKFSFSKVVQHTAIKNLSVLSTGILTPNSSIITESPLIETIIQEAAMEYDLIIVDAPPVNSNCDAYTLSKYSNGLVLVARPLHSNINTLKQTVVDLERNRASIIGLAVNNAGKQKRLSSGDSSGITPELPFLLGPSQTDNSHQAKEATSQP